MTTTGEVLKPCLIPPEWLKPGAIIPVTPETVRVLLDAVRTLSEPQGNAAQERRAALEDAIGVCNEEYLIGPSTSADDVAYNMAIDDVKDRIEKLQSAMPTESEERNFCPRCGKRNGSPGHIHTCTPPAEQGAYHIGDANKMVPTGKMIDAGVEFALQVTISGDYNWSAYVRDLFVNMIAAAPSNKEVER